MRESRPAGSRGFATTHWSVVLSAGRSQTTSGRDSLARLCRVYWYPLYGYVRRRGHEPEEAQDLTQEFFAQLLEKNWVAGSDQSKGRFRTFLLAAMSHFLSDQWDKARAIKRGGAGTILALDSDDAQVRYAREPADADTPERSFERRWGEAKAVLFVCYWTIAFVPGFLSLVCLADFVMFLVFYRGIVRNANVVIERVSQGE